VAITSKLRVHYATGAAIAALVYSVIYTIQVSGAGCHSQLTTYSLYEYNIDDGHPTRAYPPPSVRRKYRLTVKAQAKLADMNDMGKSFNEIADYIENEL
jgi:hypothetical protein